jgi:NADP-reducing hydrogenase subunit HndA
MSKKAITTVPFNGTKEQEARLMQVFAKFDGVDGPLMPVLQEAQEIYGYLPYEVLETISEKMDVPFEEIYGVVTFYTQFNLNPKGKYSVSLCMGTACYVRGAGEIFDELKSQLGVDNGGCTPDGKFSLDATRCLGCCGLAPVLTVNEDVYGRLSKDDIKSILAKY